MVTDLKRHDRGQFLGIRVIQEGWRIVKVKFGGEALGAVAIKSGCQPRSRVAGRGFTETWNAGSPTGGGHRSLVILNKVGRTPRRVLTLRSIS